MTFENKNITTIRIPVGYLEGDVKVNGSKICISMLFSWYRLDFGASDQEIVSWIRDHMPDGSAVKKDLTKLLSGSAPFTIVYNTYNWNLNSSAE